MSRQDGGRLASRREAPRLEGRGLRSRVRVASFGGWRRISIMKTDRVNVKAG